MFFTTYFLIYKTFDIYTECSQEMLNTVFSELALATLNTYCAEMLK